MSGGNGYILPFGLTENEPKLRYNPKGYLIFSLNQTTTVNQIIICHNLNKDSKIRQNLNRQNIPFGLWNGQMSLQSQKK